MYGHLYCIILLASFLLTNLKLRDKFYSFLVDSTGTKIWQSLGFCALELTTENHMIGEVATLIFH